MIAARSGEANMAIANAIGSNVFDILLGLGLPWMMRTIILGEDMPVNKEGIATNLAILFGTVTVFVACLQFNSWKMNTRTGLFLFGLYLLFVTYIIIQEIF
ncbi:unnamed protein product [Choristocarpus tenellus]